MGMKHYNFEVGRSIGKKRKWAWRCSCGRCDAILHGPFPTKRAAVRDAQATIALLIAADETELNTRH